MKSLAKIFNYDFSDGIFELYDKNRRLIYTEIKSADGSIGHLGSYPFKMETVKFDSEGNQI